MWPFLIDTGEKAEAETEVQSSPMALEPWGERARGDFMMAESDEQPRIHRFMWETVQQSQPPHRKDSCQAVRPGKQAFQASCSGLENQGNQGNQGEEHQQEPCSRAQCGMFSSSSPREGLK